MARIRTRGEQQQHRRRNFRHLHPPLPAPLAEQERCNDRGHCRAERPLVALDRLAGEACFCLVFFHFAEAVADDLFHLSGAIAEQNVEAPARFRNFPHARLVELRLHILPAVILEKFYSAALHRHGNQRAVRGTEADGESVEALLARARRSDGVRLEFFAVGENDQRAMLALALAECLVRRPDRIREICPATRDDVRINLLQRLAHRAEIRRERRLQKRRSRKREQPHAVALDLVQQILRGELCAREPVRLEVRREHRVRGVHRDDHIASALPLLLP